MNYIAEYGIYPRLSYVGTCDSVNVFVHNGQTCLISETPGYYIDKSDVIARRLRNRRPVTSMLECIPRLDGPEIYSTVGNIGRANHTVLNTKSESKLSDGCC
jgi:hypothetical protein